LISGSPEEVNDPEVQTDSPLTTMHAIYLAPHALDGQKEDYRGDPRPSRSS
jgi:hypothetical protein